MCIRVCKDIAKSGSLQLKGISDDRIFWRNVKPLFSNIIQIPESVTLLEGNEMVSDDKKVAEILNDDFVNITASLEISEVEENLKKQTNYGSL